MVDAVGKGYSIRREQLLETMNRVGDGTLFNIIADLRKTERVVLRASLACVFIDEIPALLLDQARFLLPEEIERVEYSHDGAIMRIYTRRFMARMVAENVPLKRPSIAQAPLGFRGRSAGSLASCG